MDKFIEVGRIIKAHGIKGEICIDYNADSPTLLRDSIYLAPPSGPASSRNLSEYPLLNLRMHHGRPLVTLKGVPDRTAAELLRGQRVFVPAHRLPPLDEDEIYMSDLPGLAVYLREGEAEPRELGTLSMAEIQAGQEIWTITTPDGREALLPATEDFVESIDLDAGRVVITPPPGLMEIYLDAPAKKS